MRAPADQGRRRLRALPRRRPEFLPRRRPELPCGNDLEPSAASTSSSRPERICSGDSELCGGDLAGRAMTYMPRPKDERAWALPFSSLNMQLWKELDLYASPANCANVPGFSTRHQHDGEYRQPLAACIEDANDRIHSPRRSSLTLAWALGSMGDFVFRCII